MLRCWPTLVCLLLTGCSTHPVADALDFFRPGKLYANEVQPYGGICGIQGAITPPPPTVMPVIGTPVPLAPPAVVPSVVPQPVPLPPATNLTPPQPPPPPPSFPR